MIQLHISVISSLDTNKAADVNGIPARFIKAHPASIGGLIVCLVNHSITTGIFPDLWKHAVVTTDGLIGKLYCTLTLPVLDYCDVVWSPSSAVHSRKL